MTVLAMLIIARRALGIKKIRVRGIHTFEYIQPLRLEIAGDHLLSRRMAMVVSIGKT
jgi:hypothetical protein